MRYFQLGINREETRRATNKYITDTWNSGFFDDRGKFVNDGSEKIDQRQIQTYEAIIVKYTINTLRLNKRNKRKPDQKPHTIKHLTLKFRPFEIMRLMSQDLVKSVTQRTVKEYIKRLDKADVIKIHSKGKEWLVELNKHLVYLYNPITGEQITKSKYLTTVEDKFKLKTTKSLTYSISADKKEKKRDLQDNTFTKETLLRNKEIENDKSYLKYGINDFSHKQEPDSSTSQPSIQHNSIDNSEKQEQTSEKTEKTSMKSKKSEHEEDPTNNLPSERINNKPSLKNPVQRAISKIIIEFWLFYVRVLWNMKAELYDYETAPPDYFEFIDQGIKALGIDPMYFGACNTVRKAELQYKKLKKAVVATKRWYNVQKLNNSDYNWKGVYPNKFLLNGLNEKMSFKKSVIYTENALERKRGLDTITENFLIEKRYNTLTERQLYEINSLIYHIFSEKGADKQETMWRDTKDYVAVYRPDLWDGLRYSLRPDRVQAFMLANRNFKIEFGIVTNCVLNRQIVREKIDKLIPYLESKIDKRQVVIKNALFQQYFNLQLSGGDKLKVTPHIYNQKTLETIEYFLNPKNK